MSEFLSDDLPNMLATFDPEKAPHSSKRRKGYE
jgi:hypothetical protein